MRELLRSLLHGLGMDLDEYLSTLTRLDGPDGVMIDGQYFTNQGSRGQQLHPYVAELYHETASTIGAISVHGEARFVVNRSFEKTFFTEAEAQRMLDEEVRPFSLSRNTHLIGPCPVLEHILWSIGRREGTSWSSM